MPHDLEGFLEELFREKSKMQKSMYMSSYYYLTNTDLTGYVKIVDVCEGRRHTMGGGGGS